MLRVYRFQNLATAVHVTLTFNLSGRNRGVISPNTATFHSGTGSNKMDGRPPRGMVV